MFFTQLASYHSYTNNLGVTDLLLRFSDIQINEQKNLLLLITSKIKKINKNNREGFFSCAKLQKDHKRVNKCNSPHIQLKLTDINVLIKIQPLTQERDVDDLLKNQSI